MITSVLTTLLMAACQSADESPPAAAGARASAQPSPPAEPARRSQPRLVVLGTSLTAGRGLEDPALAYPALLQQRIDAAGLDFRVVNAGVSGETSAGARSRIDWLLSEPAAVLLLETGANDGLRGQDPEALRQNILAILERARRQAPPPVVVLLGMRTLTNYGAEYGERFAAVYRELAAAERLPLVPFLLEGVGGVAELNQADGVHPTAAGQRIIADNVWKVLESVLLSLTRGPAAGAGSPGPGGRE